MFRYGAQRAYGASATAKNLLRARAFGTSTPTLSSPHKFSDVHPSSDPIIVSPKGTAVPKSLADKWHQGTFPNVVDSMEYHHKKHGGKRTPQQYTDDALDFFDKNQQLAQYGTHNPKWKPSYKLKTKTGGGYYTEDNGLKKILTQWGN